jgi:hypothetical protein
VRCCSPLPYTVGGGLTQSGGEYLDLPREESVLLHEQFINRPGEKVREFLDLPWEKSVLLHEQFINRSWEKVGSSWIFPGRSQSSSMNSSSTDHGRR